MFDSKELDVLENIAKKQGCTYKVSDGLFEAVKDGKVVLHVDSNSKSGYCLFGEHVKGKKTYHSGFAKKEVRLSGYNIEDRFNFYGPLSKYVGQTLTKKIDGQEVNVPITCSSHEQNGFRIYNYGDPDFSKYEVGPTSHISDEIKQQHPSKHIREHWQQTKNHEAHKTNTTPLTAHHKAPNELSSVPTNIHTSFQHIGWSAIMNEDVYITGQKTNQQSHAKTSRKSQNTRKQESQQSTSFLDMTANVYEKSLDYVKNNPKTTGTVIAVVVIAATVGFYLYRKHKKTKRRNP